MTFEEWWYDNQDELIGEYSIALAAWEAGQKSVLDCAYEVSLAVPKGYVLVPVEPTEKMWLAGRSELLEHYPSADEVYKAMIKAAQEEE